MVKLLGGYLYHPRAKKLLYSQTVYAKIFYEIYPYGVNAPRTMPPAACNGRIRVHNRGGKTMFKLNRKAISFILAAAIILSAVVSAPVATLAANEALTATCPEYGVSVTFSKSTYYVDEPIECTISGVDFSNGLSSSSIEIGSFVLIQPYDNYWTTDDSYQKAGNVVCGTMYHKRPNGNSYEGNVISFDQINSTTYRVKFYTGVGGGVQYNNVGYLSYENAANWLLRANMHKFVPGWGNSVVEPDRHYVESTNTYIKHELPNIKVIPRSLNPSIMALSKSAYAEGEQIEMTISGLKLNENGQYFYGYYTPEFYIVKAGSVYKPGEIGSRHYWGDVPEADIAYTSSMEVNGDTVKNGVLTVIPKMYGLETPYKKVGKNSDGTPSFSLIPGEYEVWYFTQFEGLYTNIKAAADDPNFDPRVQVLKFTVGNTAAVDAPTAPPTEALSAKPSKTAFLMNGKAVSVPEAYNVADNNYLQLRGIAMLLNGTAAQFNVTWDGTYAVIETGKPYTGTTNPATLAPTTNVRKSSTKFKIDGYVVSFDKAYYIDGDTNYLQLREFAEKLSGTASQFDIYWDSTQSKAVIEPGKPYTGAGK
jgi:hypothetical protein